MQSLPNFAVESIIGLSRTREPAPLRGSLAAASRKHFSRLFAPNGTGLTYAWLDYLLKSHSSTSNPKGPESSVCGPLMLLVGAILPLLPGLNTLIAGVPPANTEPPMT